MKVVESDLDPVARIGGYMALFHCALRAGKRAAADLLERSLAESRHVEEPQQKAAILARIGDGWLALRESAGRPRSSATPARWFLGSADNVTPRVQGLAPPLAEIDLASALAIVEGRDNTRLESNPILVRMELGEIAPRIAARNPTEAEQLLTRLGPPSANNRDASIVRTCRNMAATDLERATRIAATMLRPTVYAQGDEPLTLELYARAVMASALASHDPPAAHN